MLACRLRRSVSTIVFVGLLLVWQGSTLRAAGVAFIRGDANSSGDVDLSDAVRILNVLYLGERKPDCDDVMDANDDGSADISDGIYVLGYLFNGGAALRAPFPECGLDLTADSLVCDRYDVCGSCVGPSDVESALTTAGTCLEAGGAPISVGPATVSIVPLDLAQPCGPSEAPGWPIQISVPGSSVDLDGRSFLVHVRGVVDDMPVVVASFFSTTCSVDMTFEGDIVLRFAAAAADGALVLTGFESVEIGDATLELSASGGTLCDAAASVGDFIEPRLVEEIASFFAAQLPRLDEELGGRVICAGP